MKFFLSFLFAAVFAAVSMAQTTCQGYFAFDNGATLEYSTYDKKGALQLQSVQKIVKVENTADGAVEAVIDTKTTDSKGKSPMEGQFKVRCKDNTLIMDMSSMLGPQGASAFANLEVSITGDDLQLPANLTPGQTLPDASAQIKAGTGGVSLITMNMTIRDRKVVAKETLQTPAGSFECVKMTYVAETKMLGTKAIETAIWYADGVGMIRQESYDKKGALDSKMELTKFVKGK